MGMAKLSNDNTCLLMGFMIFLKYKSNKIKSIDNTMVYFGLSLSMNHFTGNEVIEGRKNRQ